LRTCMTFLFLPHRVFATKQPIRMPHEGPVTAALERRGFDGGVADITIFAGLVMNAAAVTSRF
jgi:hypothetical protein